MRVYSKSKALNSEDVSHLFCNRFVVKYIDKKLSGKSDEIEVKKCEIQFFTLHSSFFISRKTSFRTAKP